MLRLAVQASVPDRFLQYLPEGVEVVRIPAETEEIFEAEMWVIPFGHQAAQQMWKRLRGVQVAQSIMAGVDWILPWLPRDVTLCDGRGVHDISTSEWILSAILASYKRLPFYRDMQQKEEWRGAAQATVFTDEDEASNGLYRILGEDLNDKHVLIVGYGSIGSAVEQRLLPFGVKVTRMARTAKSNPQVHAIEDLHTYLPQADAVVLILPLTDQTRGLIGAPQMAMMKRGALLVNAARGPVVHTEALLESLQTGHLRAALDVSDPEPLPAGHPLWHAPNLLLTPHVAGSTPQFIDRAFRFVGQQAQRMLCDEALQNIVTDAGY